MFKLRIIANEERPPVAATTNGLGNLENETAYANENAFTPNNIPEVEPEYNSFNGKFVASKGRKAIYSPTSGIWTIIVFDGHGTCTWEESGRVEFDHEPTPDELDLVAAKQAILMATLEFAGTTVVFTDSSNVAAWLSDEANPHYQEIYRERYRQKSNGNYLIDVISEPSAEELVDWERETESGGQAK